MRLWQIIKSKFNETIGNTRAELKLNKDNNSNEYIINGVRYIVSTQFSKTENKTMKEKLSDFIGSGKLISEVFIKKSILFCLHFSK